jgi:hypothetical protein
VVGEMLAAKSESFFTFSIFPRWSAEKISKRFGNTSGRAKV